MCVLTSPAGDSDVGSSLGITEIRLIIKSRLSVLPALYQTMIFNPENSTTQSFPSPRA